MGMNATGEKGEGRQCPLPSRPEKDASGMLDAKLRRAPREGNGERNAVKVARCVRRGEHAPAHEVGRFLPYPKVGL